ncbi:MAG: enoyl-CoA hydratase/isomerase family protein [Deltaproteobacteria bacterium]|nr:enoyl-CoA hydratase/isomerase family protein [Deltaproteobacteria bacterium]
MPSYQNIKFDLNGHIAIITIDHPPANTWNLATLNEFEDAVGIVENDSNVRVLILTGAGEKCFSAGFDVSDSANSPIISPKARTLWRRIDRFSKPVIAAINGHALGGGLELAISCHFRIMADAPKAMIGLTELNLGIIPGWGGSQRLSRIVGRSRALEMILMSKKVSATQAFEIGLVNQLSAPEALMDDALAFAGVLAARPPIAVRCVLDAISAGLYEGLDAGLDVEAQGSATVRSSEDCKEGFTAFLEKRKPVFTGK